MLLACGAAAGMSATFNTPIAGVILAIELLLFEFKARSFIPLVIASTLATAVHMQLLGPGPMFSVSAVDFGIPHALPFYLVLGPVCGIAAVLLSKALYWVEDTFEKLPLDERKANACGGDERWYLSQERHETLSPTKQENSPVRVGIPSADHGDGRMSTTSLTYRKELCT